jgi:hypothetical protein
MTTPFASPYFFDKVFSAAGVVNIITPQQNRAGVKIERAYLCGEAASQCVLYVGSAAPLAFNDPTQRAIAIAQNGSQGIDSIIIPPDLGLWVAAGGTFTATLTRGSGSYIFLK